VAALGSGVMLGSAQERFLERAQTQLHELARTHSCSAHPLFDYLRSQTLTRAQVAAVLRNYDAHASVLRRLLLKAAAIMPEAAVGYILENVRNEYGNGDYSRNHQSQLQDVAWSAGISRETYFNVSIKPEIKRFISEAVRFYDPAKNVSAKGHYKPAVAAGAITATELLAIEEFKALQCAFVKLGLEHHIWFHHVAIEEQHSDDSVALALHFMTNSKWHQSVLYGLNGILDANVYLYDGLFSALLNPHPDC
jgi:hypothetical protein